MKPTEKELATINTLEERLNKTEDELRGILEECMQYHDTLKTVLDLFPKGDFSTVFGLADAFTIPLETPEGDVEIKTGMEFTRKDGIETLKLYEIDAITVTKENADEMKGDPILSWTTGEDTEEASRFFRFRKFNYHTKWARFWISKARAGVIKAKHGKIREMSTEEIIACIADNIKDLEAGVVACGEELKELKQPGAKAGRLVGQRAPRPEEALLNN